MSPLRPTFFGALSLALVLPAAAAVGAEEAPAPDVVRAPQVVAAGDVKIAVVGSAESLVGTPFTVIDETEAAVHNGTLEVVAGDPAPWAHAAAADFTAVEEPGTYQVVVGGVESGPVVLEANPYPAILSSLFGIYDANADGKERSSLHGPSHLNDTRSKMRNGPSQGRVIDVSGGWMDAGDRLKFTTTIAQSTTLLQMAARHEPSRARAINAVADVGVRWLLKAHPSKRVFVSQVGDVDADHNSGFRDPTFDDTAGNALLKHRPSLVLTGSTGGTDVAAMAATALALAARRASGDRRDRLVRAAKEWFAKAQQLKGPWKNCCYQQDTVKDDLSAAAVELWRVTGKKSYRDQALAWLKAVTSNGGSGWRVGLDGFSMAGLPAGELCGVLGPAPSSSVRSVACRILEAGGQAAMFNADDNAFGRAGALTWGSVRNNNDGSLIAMLAGRAGLPGAHVTSVRALGWFLGANPWGVRFQAGYGVQHPYHWAQLQGPALPRGAVVGGPERKSVIDDQYLGEDSVLGPFDTEDALYRDVPDDWVTNEVSINYTAGSVLLLALLSPN